MWELISHFWRRLFHGSVITVADHAEGGQLIQYDSGYIEYKDKHGGVRDIHFDLYLQRYRPRDWQCLSFGGGTKITYHMMKRDEAMKRCATELGIVAYVDDHHGLIFFKSRDWRPSTTEIE